MERLSFSSFIFKTNTSYFHICFGIPLYDHNRGIQQIPTVQIETESLCVSFKQNMADNSSQREDVLSQTEEVIISEDLPAIEAGSESSALNRLGKLVQKVGQNQWISELDLFSIPMKLNFNGDETHKTQFGGLMFLLTAFVCIFLTMVNQFPDGLILNRPITSFTVNQPLQNSPSFFDHTDTFFQIYVYNKKMKRLANTQEAAFIFNKMFVFSVIKGVATKLETSFDCKKGLACFKDSEINRQAFIQGNISYPNQTYLQVEISSCYIMDSSPVVGSCFFGLGDYVFVMELTNFRAITGDLKPITQSVVLQYNIGQIIEVDQASFKTNSKIFGHISNVMNYQIDFYQPKDFGLVYSGVKPFDTTVTCFDMAMTLGHICLPVRLQWSGFKNKYIQNFDDITAPILFFISLMETFFFLFYILIIKNYANNALYLKIADSLTYLEDSNGKHHNFKSGPGVFFACLIHNNIITQGIDQLLYRGCETQIKRLLPLKTQLAMKMIDYGQKCLGEEMVFDQMNKAYEQENLQPTKIVFEEEPEQSELSEKEKSLKEEEESDDGQPFFTNQIDEEAFKRMCKDHQFYSPSRKRHLAFVLKRTEKTFKLALQAQSLFEKYRAQVRAQNASKEVQLPIGFNIEDESAMHIHKSNVQ